MRWNVSNLFLVPLLNIGRNRLDKHGFINSYILNQEEELDYESDRHQFLMPQNMGDVKDFKEDEKERRAVILDEHDYPGGFILLTYELPKRFKRDYQLILQGKFSKTSEAYRSAIPAVVKTKSNNVITSTASLQHMVFNKDAALKQFWEKMFDVTMEEDQELWTCPTVEQETFKIIGHEELFAANLRRPR